MGRLKDAFDSIRVGGTASMDDITSMTDITVDTITVVPSPQRELRYIGFATNPAKTFSLPPRRHNAKGREKIYISNFSSPHR